jgi:hypothetical protein
MRPRALTFVTLAVPATLLVYAAARLLDGRDGSHGPGFWWNVGHLAFLGTWSCFAILAGYLVRTSSPVVPGLRLLAIPVLAGVAAFSWVVLGDLGLGLPDLPDPLRTAGPLALLIGFVPLVGATARARSVSPWWLYPILVAAALLLVGADLDLLPLTALLLVPALRPFRAVAATARQSSQSPADEFRAGSPR